MAQSPKIWRKKDGQWVKTTPDVTKADVGLGNVANYPPTNSATDGSSSKYATGAAVKAAYDRASAALNKANSGVSLGPTQATGWEYLRDYNQIVSFLARSPNGGAHVLTSVEIKKGYQQKCRWRYRRIL